MIKWEKPKRALNVKKDVHISFVSIKEKPYIRITFRENSEKRIVAENGRMIFGVEGGRMYFKADECGYKLSKTRTSKVISVAVKSKKYTEFAGDHDLCFDSISGLFFIKETEDEID